MLRSLSLTALLALGLPLATGLAAEEADKIAASASEEGAKAVFVGTFADEEWGKGTMTLIVREANEEGKLVTSYVAFWEEEEYIYTGWLSQVDADGAVTGYSEDDAQDYMYDLTGELKGDALKLTYEGGVIDVKRKKAAAE